MFQAHERYPPFPFPYSSYPSFAAAMLAESPSDATAMPSWQRDDLKAKQHRARWTLFWNNSDLRWQLELLLTTKGILEALRTSRSTHTVRAERTEVHILDSGFRDMQRENEIDEIPKEIDMDQVAGFWLAEALNDDRSCS